MWLVILYPSVATLAFVFAVLGCANDAPGRAWHVLCAGLFLVALGLALFATLHPPMPSMRELALLRFPRMSYAALEFSLGTGLLGGSAVGWLVAVLRAARESGAGSSAPTLSEGHGHGQPSVASGRGGLYARHGWWAVPLLAGVVGGAVVKINGGGHWAAFEFGLFAAAFTGVAGLLRREW
jgi:hypothetical protein